MLPPVSSAYQQSLAFLYERINYEQAAAPRRGLQLGRMRRLMAGLGDPHLAVPIVHVAGTKGKGSVATMLAASLQAAGYRTGLYTSPHLEKLEERYVMNGLACSEAELIALVDAMRPVVAEFAAKGDSPTFFELTTAMAFYHFLQRGAQVAVVEVGMGGRLDSTNVCQPLLAVITSISFDHTKQLGDTLEAIAAEKAGIIKPGVPTVSGVTAAGAREKIAAVAQQQGSPLYAVGEQFSYEYQPATAGPAALHYAASPPTPLARLTNVQLGMLGAHQAANAATAIASLAELMRQGWQIDERAIRRGLAEARSPARIEYFPGTPPILLDAAHNAASARALADTLAECFPQRPKRLLFAISREKEAQAVLGPLGEHFEEIVCTQFLSNPRACPAQELAAAAQSVPGASWQVTHCEDPHQALNAMLAGTNSTTMICIAGSFFLAAELRSRLLATSGNVATYS